MYYLAMYNIPFNNSLCIVEYRNPIGQSGPHTTYFNTTYFNT